MAEIQGRPSSSVVLPLDSLGEWGRNLPCPIAEIQSYGGIHIHDESCSGSPAQIKEQRERLMKEAYLRYRRHFYGRLRPGCLRLKLNGDFCYLPLVVDNVENLFVHLWLRAQRRCIDCRMRGVHKPDCYHSWTLRDDLRALRLYPRRKADRST